ncbi:hypothetical protein ACFV6F_35715, partial [Kitasatospora phosalacinea]|uniref:hypothetical protein n=1 Tax=Kitasatospora phosalacinea TaxID=2065 RepID=UPI00365506DD
MRFSSARAADCGGAVGVEEGEQVAAGPADPPELIRRPVAALVPAPPPVAGGGGGPTPPRARGDRWGRA